MGHLLVASVKAAIGSGLTLFGALALLGATILFFMKRPTWDYSPRRLAAGCGALGLVLSGIGGTLNPTDSTATTDDASDTTAIESTEVTLSTQSAAVLKWANDNDLNKIGRFTDPFVEAKRDGSTYDMLAALKQMREDRLFLYATLEEDAPDEVKPLLASIFGNYESAIQLLITGLNTDDAATANQGLRLITDAKETLKQLFGMVDAAIAESNALD
jgi:hypothetical protein